MNQYTKHPLVFQLFTGKPFMWSTWIMWSMEYRQHTTMGEKLIDLIMFEWYFKILTIFIGNPTNTNSAQFDFSLQKLISHFNLF